jgi:hypothetical protein
MEHKVRCIEVKTPDGKPILSLHLQYQLNSAGAQNNSAKSQNGPLNSQSSNDSPMTDAQKRYLFRILAEKGKEEDQAHEFLKQMFGVDSLRDVSKYEASKGIEHLLEEG